MKRAYGLFVALGLGVTGCASVDTYAMPALKKQASFDMNCPEDQLQVAETGTYKYGVKGCGKRATYAMYACNRMTKECTFLLDGAVNTD
jgi:hypothetical protein